MFFAKVDSDERVRKKIVDDAFIVRWVLGLGKMVHQKVRARKKDFIIRPPFSMKCHIEGLAFGFCLMLAPI